MEVDENSFVASAGKQGTDEDCSVCVAVHIRPLIANEVSEGCQTCLGVAESHKQVFAGANSFTYDHVFGGGGVPEDLLYSNCVESLVEGLFKGYNATVFAYGQTGSGKTYTMGSAFVPGGIGGRGVIPKVMDTIFSKIEAARDTAVTVRVGFVEIHTEEIRDLLIVDAQAGQNVHIREVPGGGICLAGATEKEVATKIQMADLLSQGTLQRATASTNMNKHSSRSHAIFTITVEQRRHIQTEQKTAGDEDVEDEGEEALEDYLCAKMHLVDLAGSERAKRTKAEGQRLKEGININRGLLALGNVISALSDGKTHVPYRDSKLTRMLQDSLGGNSRTVMIACVSPADVNLEESMNTLRYANRARNIKNKPVVNRDPNAAQISHLRQQLSMAKAEISLLKQRQAATGMEADPRWRDAEAASKQLMAAAVDEMQVKVCAVEIDNARLRVDLEACKQELKMVSKKLMDCQAERDCHALRLEQIAPQDVEENRETRLANQGILQKHLHHIADLEAEVTRLKKIQRASGAYMVSARKKGLSASKTPCLAHDPPSPLPFPDFATLSSEMDVACSEEADSSLAEDEEIVTGEHSHMLEQQKVAGELEKLQQVLESKEAQMARVMSGDGQIASLKGHYDRILGELQVERDELKRERMDLLQRLQNVKSNKEEDRSQLEVRYRQQLQEKEKKLKEVAKKEKKYAQIERLQAKSQATCQRLQSDILAIKQQKVQLTRTMERNQREFQQWRKQRENELMRLKRQGLKAAAHVQRLEALQAKQQAVLKRKTEEAEAARKRLKDMVEVHQRAGEMKAQRPLQTRGNGIEAQPNNTAPLLRDEKARKEWIEYELDMCCQSFELQRVLEGEKAQRTETARQMQEAQKRSAAAPAGKARDTLLAKSAQLQDELQKQSKQILETQQLLMKAKAEEDQKTQAACDARRWNGLKTIVEARALLKSLFKVATSQKAQMYENHVEISEAREENELLRLKLETAVQEAEEARRQTAAAQSGLAAALAGQTALSPRETSPTQPSSADKLGKELEHLMEELNSGKACSPHQKSAAAEDHSAAESGPSEDESDEGDDVWDPQHATPWQARQRQRRSRSGSAGSSQANAVLQISAEEIEDTLKSMRNQTEYPILMDINHDRSREGLSPVVKLTVPVLKTHLKGKSIAGSEWKMGNKKREDLIEDYREYLGVRHLRKGSAGESSKPMPSKIRRGMAFEEVLNPRASSPDLHEAQSCRPVEHEPLRSLSVTDNSSYIHSDPNIELRNDVLQEPAKPKGNDLHGDVLPPLSQKTPATGSPLHIGVEQPEVQPGSASPTNDQSSSLTAVSPSGQDGTPSAKFYNSVREQCHAAMHRAQAFKHKMDCHATGSRLQPSISLLTTGASCGQQLPEASRPIENLPLGPKGDDAVVNPISTEQAARILAGRLPARGEEPFRVPKLWIPNKEAEEEESRNQSPLHQRPSRRPSVSSKPRKTSPSRCVLGDIPIPSGPASPYSRLSEAELEPQTGQLRRSQTGNSVNGPLSVKGGRQSLFTPRPRAAWL